MVLLMKMNFLSDFINKYKIKKDLNYEGRLKKFILNLTWYRCSGNGFMLYTKAVLRNRDSKLDTSLNPSNGMSMYLYMNLFEI